jgi:methyl-accepting chemotaxis protein
MTIKSKLTINIAIVLIIVCAVSVTSVVGMRFIKSELTYLTERSTPYQVKTLEFQKAIQNATTELIKVSSAHSMDEYKSSREDAQKTLSDVKGSQESLQALSGDTNNTAFRDIERISNEIFATTESRLRTEGSVLSVNKTIAQKLKEFSLRLNDLDSKVRSMQLNLFANFMTLVGDASDIKVVRDSDALTKANIATNVLISTSELVTMGTSIEALVNKLPNATKDTEIRAIHGEIAATFKKIEESVNHIEKFMKKVKAEDEIKTLDKVMKSLQATKGEITSLVAALQGRISSMDQTSRSNAHLREVVLKQAARGKETVTAAKGEQEEAIGKVNKTVHSSILLIMAISTGAVFLGIGFGSWIYRSIQKPLTGLISVADDIANGNLTSELDKASDDEIGRLAKTMNKMVESFSDVIGKILTSVNNTVQVLDILRQESQNTSDGSKKQANQAGQIAAIAEEMSRTISDIAKNASSASQSASEARSVANSGQTVAANAVTTVNNVHASTLELSTSVEQLNHRVGEIGEVVTVIKEIADQTNLLALNAAIEAARAGEQGRGFAVVADEVRRLAERTIKSTDDVSAKIGAVQSESAQTTKSMETASEKVAMITGQIKEVEDSLSNIVRAVENANDQITRIATAMEEQSAASEEVASNIEKTTVIASEQHAIAARVLQEVSDLIKVTEELRTLTTRFRIRGNELIMLDLAKADHRLFVGKVNSFLRGDATMDLTSLPDHHACRFGKWYDTEGKRLCGNQAGFKAIDSPHERFHALAKGMAEAYIAGNKELAGKKFSEMSLISGQIVNLLEDIKREYKP